MNPMPDKLRQPTDERGDAAEELFAAFARAALAAGHCLSDSDYALAWRPDESGHYYQISAWPRRRGLRAVVVGAVLTETGEALATEEAIEADPHPASLVDRALRYWVGRKFGQVDDTTFHETDDPTSPGVTWAWLVRETAVPALICSATSLVNYIRRQEHRALPAPSGPLCPPSPPANSV